MEWACMGDLKVLFNFPKGSAKVSLLFNHVLLSPITLSILETPDVPAIGFAGVGHCPWPWPGGSAAPGIQPASSLG